MVDLVIFSGSPQYKEKSSTACVVEAFGKGFQCYEENHLEVYFLYERGRWSEYKEIFKNSSNIILAMPLYVECIPGLVMEFIEFIEAKEEVHRKNNKLGFIIQGGFDEAHQLRTAEHYCENLSACLNCTYTGTLIKGGMFGLKGFRSDSFREKALSRFYEVGKNYATTGFFHKEAVTSFAAPERYSNFIILASRITKPLNKIAWWYISKKIDADDKLDARPYDIG
jgi:hypothetical protein